MPNIHVTLHTSSHVQENRTPAEIQSTIYKNKPIKLTQKLFKRKKRKNAKESTKIPNEEKEKQNGDPKQIAGKSKSNSGFRVRVYYKIK